MWWLLDGLDGPVGPQRYAGRDPAIQHADQPDARPIKIDFDSAANADLIINRPNPQRAGANKRWRGAGV